ncbi:hypothetical protein COT51_00490 [candidate division WWE3 bacterium CG08_land_8_20_14_0_20_41_15]|uniref:Uncharacterized protein n=1 Tax=candidate division WWE3 bacterium CG08_land_8_20_14_0_20_41_15 TaxID=1975086 RepID=A0A2H0XAC5_UNCKA|nr:MAG: hypothetical protein COT51_00490 [candidate division WWE3 bacterium CG08_land_8_20_14_0_20_41_15]
MVFPRRVSPLGAIAAPISFRDVVSMASISRRSRAVKASGSSAIAVIGESVADRNSKKTIRNFLILASPASFFG